MADMCSDLAIEDVPSLTDDELFERLTALGVSVGPIVESTRRIYQKKLTAMLGGDVVDSPYTDEVDLDEYAADEEITANVVHHVARSSPKKVSPRRVDSELHTRSRKRLLEQDFENEFAHETPSTGCSPYSSDLHTPSPRPSLRTVTSTTTTTTRYSTTPGGTVHRIPEEHKFSVNKFYMRLFVKFLFMVIFAVAISLIYQYYNNSSPLEGLEELARQALDAYKGRTAEEVNSPPKPSKSQPK